MECDKVLVSVGRRPYTEGLNLSKIGINKDKKGRIKNYIQVWITLLNTVKKGEVEKQAVRILHQTNCQRNN